MVWYGCIDVWRFLQSFQMAERIEQVLLLLLCFYKKIVCFGGVLLVNFLLLGFWFSYMFVFWISFVTWFTTRNNLQLFVFACLPAKVRLGRKLQLKMIKMIKSEKTLLKKNYSYYYFWSHGFHSHAYKGCCREKCVCLFVSLVLFCLMVYIPKFSEVAIRFAVTNSVQQFKGFWSLERDLHFHLQKILVLSFYWISFDFSEWLSDDLKFDIILAFWPPIAVSMFMSLEAVPFVSFFMKWFEDGIC